MGNNVKHTPDAQDLFIAWFDDLDAEANVDSEETRSRDLCEIGFMAGRASLLDVNTELLAALEWVEKAWGTGALKNEDGETPDLQIVLSAIAKAKGE